MDEKKKKSLIRELYRKYGSYFPADLWAYLIVIIIIALAAIFIL